MSAIAFPLLKQVGIGIACGCADAIFSITTQKICMLAGVKFEEFEEEGDARASERLDKEFADTVFIWPIAEELVFRAVLQPSLSTALLFFMPKLSVPVVLGLSGATIISAIAIGILFGAIHYPIYKSGGKQAASVTAIGGVFYGIIKARFGLVTSISAHVAHNYVIGKVDKHFPAFLDSNAPQKA